MASVGYSNWGEYVASEFDMSRRRSYQLLDQGLVIRELESVQGVNPGTHEAPLVNEKEARAIKPKLAEVKADVQERVEAGEEPKQAIREAVQEARKPDPEPEPAPPPEPVAAPPRAPSTPPRSAAPAGDDTVPCPRCQGVGRIKRSMDRYARREVTPNFRGKS